MASSAAMAAETTKSAPTRNLSREVFMPIRRERGLHASVRGQRGFHDSFASHLDGLYGLAVMGGLADIHRDKVSRTNVAGCFDAVTVIVT
jgi:hypothetical protein